MTEEDYRERYNAQVAIGFYADCPFDAAWIKAKAINMVGNAVRRGVITRGPCEVCGTDKMVVAHHDDYGRPLKVRFLCRYHHGQWHLEHGEATLP
jgi:hypothetical protein